MRNYYDLDDDYSVVGDSPDYPYCCDNCRLGHRRGGDKSRHHHCGRCGRYGHYDHCGHYDPFGCDCAVVDSGNCFHHLHVFQNARFYHSGSKRRAKK